MPTKGIYYQIYAPEDSESSYKRTIDKIQSDQNRQLKKASIELELETEQYLERMEDERAELKDYFRELANQFYPRSVAGLPINNVKTFCHDLTLLFKGCNHTMGFLFHDSRLFDGIDERQKAVLFSILSERFTTSPYQYIATINQNQLEEIRRELGDIVYDTIITPHVVLTLADESPEAKLLGIGESGFCVSMC